MMRLLLLLASAMMVVLVAACVPPARPLAMRADGAQVLSWLYLDERGPARADATFRFAAPDAVMAGVALQSLTRTRLSLSFSCDGAARLRDTPWGVEPAELGQHPGWADAGTALRASLDSMARDRLVLDLAPEVTHCHLQVQTGPDARYTLRLERDDVVGPARAVPAAPSRQASPPVLPADDALAAAFHAQRPLAMTEALPGGGAMRLLADGPDALNARVEALTGTPLPRAALLAGDPTIPLDFSNAPQIDAIYISYLYISADFVGTLLERMLLWHAERGAEIRIQLADALINADERRLVENLAARHPGIQIQLYRFPGRPLDGAEEWLARYHRVNHTKLFLTLAQDPERSRAIIGGRNWHDSYFFAEPHDLSAFPELRDYTSISSWSWMSFRPFEDLELEVAGPALVEAIGAQFMGFWNRDHVSDRPLVWSPPAVDVPRGDGPMARHFLSVPWADDEAQIALFVDLIDAARVEIDIVTPFVSIPAEIEAALERAIARGVSVRFVTAVRLSGPDGVVLNNLLAEFLSDWADRVTVHGFSEGDLRLHSKLFVFDRRLSMVAATNLNQRSFFHDTENGVMVLDRRFAERSIAQIEEYIRRGQRLRDVRDVPESAFDGIVSALLRRGWIRRAF